MGELLFKVSGISGKASELDEDDVVAEATSAESSRRALLEVLGLERRDRILAALYLVRQDGVVVVRQASMQIWKALVHNTPRTGKTLHYHLLKTANLPTFNQLGRSFLNSLIKSYSLFPQMNMSNRRYGCVTSMQVNSGLCLSPRLQVEPSVNFAVNLANEFWEKLCLFSRLKLLPLILAPERGCL